MAQTESSDEYAGLIEEDDDGIEVEAWDAGELEISRHSRRTYIPLKKPATRIRKRWQK